MPCIKCGAIFILCCIRVYAGTAAAVSFFFPDSEGRYCMRINRIRLNCRRERAFPAELGAFCSFYYFRTPVIVSGAGSEAASKGGAAIVLFGGSRYEFSPVNGGILSFDCVTFRINAAEKQYITDLGVPSGELIAVRDDYVISNILRCMKVQSTDTASTDGEFMELSLRLIMLALSGFVSGEDNASVRRIPRYAELRSVREAIYDDPTGEWSSAMLAEDMGISRAYFHRIYFEAFGVTCRQDVIASRLMYASELLKNTDLSVSAIAERCGYESESYFMRQFKQHKGCTPSEFRSLSERKE